MRCGDEQASRTDTMRPRLRGASTSAPSRHRWRRSWPEETTRRGTFSNWRECAHLPHPDMLERLEMETAGRVAEVEERTHQLQGCRTARAIARPSSNGSEFCRLVSTTTLMPISR